MCTAPGIPTHLAAHDEAAVGPPGAGAHPGRVGVTETTASSGVAPGDHLDLGHPRPRRRQGAGRRHRRRWSTGHSSTCSTRCERCRRNPTAPLRSTARRTRRPPAEPVAAALHRPRPSISRSTPAIERRSSVTRSAFSRRWAPTSTCWKSHPPHRPGPAWGHGGSTRSGEAIQDLRPRPPAGTSWSHAVMRARTRSPGSEWRTKTTLPSGARATQPPPPAIAPTSSSSRSSPPEVVIPASVRRPTWPRFPRRGVDPGPARSS